MNKTIILLACMSVSIQTYAGAGSKMFRMEQGTDINNVPYLKCKDRYLTPAPYVELHIQTTYIRLFGSDLVIEKSIAPEQVTQARFNFLAEYFADINTLCKSYDGYKF